MPLILNCWPVDGLEHSSFRSHTEAVLYEHGPLHSTGVSAGELPGRGRSGAKRTPIFVLMGAAKLSSHRNSPV